MYQTNTLTKESVSLFTIATSRRHTKQFTQLRASTQIIQAIACEGAFSAIILFEQDSLQLSNCSLGEIPL